jgi:hypothetical protein
MTGNIEIEDSLIGSEFGLLGADAIRTPAAALAAPRAASAGADR